MKYASAHPFLQLGKYYLRDEGRPKNQYSRREEIMKGLEKLKAVDVEKGKNKE
jgi:hypothetical protein